MNTTKEFEVRRVVRSRAGDMKEDRLSFGQYVSDHMMVCDFYGGKWQDPRILPFANLSISPAALALHYGQTVFEGMKAFRMKDNRINVFRPDRHYQRLLRSLERMCMQPVPEEIFREGIRKLVTLDRDWVPRSSGSALYIRPFMYASEPRFGIKIADEYRFLIITGPVPSLYAQPIKVKVERDFVRAAPGGTGAAKCGGNYGGALMATKIAREQGYDQVLWTDARDNRFIEESGMMNVMFVISGTIVTPPLSDTILDGVTRDSLLTLAGDLGIPVEERRIDIKELEAAYRTGSLTEAFGVGTAAVVAPIGVIGIDDTDISLPAYSHESVCSRLQQQLEAIRTGITVDIHRWNWIVDGE